MLIRLLLSALMLTGTFPARSCTCAAADASTPADFAQPAGAAVEAPPAVPEKACRCSHRSAARGAENAASISAAAHCPACSGESIGTGLRNGVPSVIAVRTNPGHAVVIVTPRLRSAGRSPSR